MQTSIRINNVWSHVHNMPAEMQRQIYAWEGQLPGVYGITSTNGDILSGVIPLLFGSKLLNYEIIDERVVPCITGDIPCFIDRDYQRAAVQTALWYHRGILKLPTGAGKSFVIAGLAKALDCSHLILVHKANLVEDLASTLSQLLKEEIGKVHGRANDYNKRVVCATYKSLYSRHALLEFVQTREAITADECHNVPALTHFALLLNTYKAYYRFGLSATPLIRQDRKDIHTVGLLGPIIYEVKNEHLYNEGHVVPPEVIWLNAVTHTTQTDYAQGYNEAIVDNLFRNQAAKQVLDFEELPAIVFVKTHKHQQKLINLLEPKHGRKVYGVNQHSSTADRQRVVEALKRGELSVVVSTKVFNEGMDVPALRTVINLTGAASLIDAIQPSGRGSRPAKNKQTFKLYDFNDQGHPWFEEHTAQRYKAYKEAGYTVKPPNGRANVVELVHKNGNVTKLTERRQQTESVWWCVAWFIFVIVLLGISSCLNWLAHGDKK